MNQNQHTTLIDSIIKRAKQAKAIYYNTKDTGDMIKAHKWYRLYLNHLEHLRINREQFKDNFGVEYVNKLINTKSQESIINTRKKIEDLLLPKRGQYTYDDVRKVSYLNQYYVSDNNSN